MISRYLAAALVLGLLGTGCVSNKEDAGSATGTGVPQRQTTESTSDQPVLPASVGAGTPTPGQSTPMAPQAPVTPSTP